MLACNKSTERATNKIYVANSMLHAGFDTHISVVCMHLKLSIPYTYNIYG